MVRGLAVRYPCKCKDKTVQDNNGHVLSTSGPGSTEFRGRLRAGKQFWHAA